MANMAFNTTENQTIGRELLLAYLNTGTAAAPVWSPMGRRVNDSSMEMDWGKDTSTDIWGDTHTTMKTPVITQNFDPWPMVNGDAAQKLVWDTGIRDQDAQAMCNMDVLVVHLYAGTKDTAAFAERYDSCAIEVTSFGGTGGGNIGMATNVTYGGTRTVGTAAVADGTVTFSAAA